MSNHAQTMSALKIGNEVRRRRNQIRKDVHANRMTVPAALADRACATARVAEVLAWQARWSEGRAERFLSDHQICTPFATSERLTDRQRMLVARALRHDFPPICSEVGGGPAPQTGGLAA